jgi:hypothetical protein
MATETTSIDDLLMGNTVQNSQHPAPEVYDDTPEENDHNDPETNDYSEPNTETEPQEEAEDESDNQEQKQELDDYGNEKPAPRVYTEDEVNELFRKRFKRGNHQQQQPAPQPQYQQTQQQAASQFEYNPDSGDNWQQQLEQFVEQTIDKRTQRQVSQQHQQQEMEAVAQFRDKFEQGMDKFSDFYEVVGGQPVDDAMTLALRAVADPASFIYAASKRHPQELQRISQLRDPYAKIAEMGKLEERMKKAAQATKAPRPVGRSADDAPVKYKENSKEPSIEQMIAKSEAKKLAMMKQRRAK